MRRQNGFGLIELMIALALGLTLIAGILSVFLSTLQSNTDLANNQQLDNEMQATMDLMIRDLRRAGGNGSPSPLPNFTNPFGLGSLGAYSGEAANSCVLFSYDLNNNGVLDTASSSDERFGYRLKQGVVQMRTGGLSCTQDSWINITTPAVVKVTQLQFTIVPMTDGGMVVNRISVLMTGQLTRNAGVTRSLTSNVRVRNDVWTPS
ncbi:MAG: prepilin-type N-terminal cleavage/methylation domain-containing protein [Stenotrophobium sp.]